MNRAIVTAETVWARVSPTLERELQSASDPHPDVGYTPRSIAASDLEAARAVLASYAAMDAPINPRALLAWLKPLAASVANAPSAEDFQTRLQAACVGLGALPSWVLNHDTQRDALQRFKFFPSVAELYELLSEYRHINQRRRRALEDVVEHAVLKTLSP